MIQATNDNLWVRRYATQTKLNGIYIPDSAQKKLHKGIIITAGELTSDKNINPGRTAIFNKNAGFEIEEDGVVYTILKQIDIVGTDEYKKETYV